MDENRDRGVRAEEGGGQRRINFDLGGRRGEYGVSRGQGVISVGFVKGDVSSCEGRESGGNGSKDRGPIRSE